MARRGKNNEGLIAVLAGAPWQLSVAVSGVVFAIMRWLVPAQFDSPALAPLASVISGFAPMAALPFLFIAVIAFIRGRQEPAAVHNHQPVRRVPLNDGSGRYVAMVPPPSDWSLGLLRSLEWKRFEMVCAEYFRILGKRVETVSHGADGGIDARVYAKDSDVMTFAIQCKAWDGMVGVKPVRELFGVMAHESAGKGIFMATSGFTGDAKQFAAEHQDKLFLIDGEKFLTMLSKLPEDKRKKLLEFATEGDYTTPTCASCGVKMVRRTGKGGAFWGCMNYPHCRSTLFVKNNSGVAVGATA
ncbi:MAG TPA: restriction endonuclease [Gallionella sp.]|nr:restriction endonuclease [Gallionella sp.]